MKLVFPEHGAHKNSFTEHLSDVSQILIKYTQGVRVQPMIVIMVEARSHARLQSAGLGPFWLCAWSRTAPW